MNTYTATSTILLTGSMTSRSYTGSFCCSLSTTSLTSRSSSVCFCCLISFVRNFSLVKILPFPASSSSESFWLWTATIPLQSSAELFQTQSCSFRSGIKWSKKDCTFLVIPAVNACFGWPFFLASLTDVMKRFLCSFPWLSRSRVVGAWLCCGRYSAWRSVGGSSLGSQLSPVDH